MIDFSKYDMDYEVPLNPANFIGFTNMKTDDRLARSENYYMQADAYLECADELAKWLYDNTHSANAFDYGIMIYLANHSVELKIKAILIRNNEQDITGHNCLELAAKIPEVCFCEIIDNIGKSELISNLEALNKYNTNQNELGRYIEDKNGSRFVRDNVEVFIPLISIAYRYHQVIDLLNKNYRRINKKEGE